MTDVPTEGATVVLRDQQGRAYRSEVVRCTPGSLVLQPPRDLPAARAFPLGTLLLVTWPDDTSLWVLPVMLIDVEAAGDLGLLVAQIQGAAWREERREYARSALDATLTIGYDGPDSELVGVPGELIDLSEVALRAVVAHEHEALCQPRRPVLVRIDVADDSFEIGGYVLLGKPAARLDLGLEVVVLFHRPVPRVEELRQHLGGLVSGS